MTVLVLLLLTILFVYACWSWWPHRTLFWVFSRLEKRRYHLYYEGSKVLPSGPCLIVIPEDHFLFALLIKRLTYLPVTYISDDKVPSFILRSLMKKAGLSIQSASRTKETPPGIVIVSWRYYQRLQLDKTLPRLVAYLCGSTFDLSVPSAHVVHQWMQLSLHPAPDNLRDLSEIRLLEALSWEAYTKNLPSIPELWLRQAKAGGNRLSVTDSTGANLTHHRLIVGVMSMREKLNPLLKKQMSVGCLLPPSVAAIVTTLSLYSLGKTLVNLNYTASESALESAVEQAGIQSIVTSRKFVENLEKKGFPVDGLLGKLKVIYLEDIKAGMKKPTLLKNLVLAKVLPFALLKRYALSALPSERTAAVLFSSGSEGKPKGIELTHLNIIGNAKQAAQAIEIRTHDKMLGTLPIFHAFGLTATTLLPLIEGIHLVCHPDPRDGVIIGQMVQKHQVTLLCGTSTFFRLYAKSRNLTPDMFDSLRYVIAGAERLLPEVRVLFEERFKKMIYEGYGTTELSPVVSANKPDTPHEIRHKIGTVGMPIAGCLIKIVDPESEETLPVGASGLIMVGGVNVMKGYLNDPEKTASVIAESQGIRWYKTGDKGRLDHNGFLTILDRYSRFAKLGGEMVSLSAVEGQIALILNMPEIELLAVALPDNKKGEQVILMYAGEIEERDLQQKVLHSDMLNLMKPQHYFKVAEIPKLGTGKNDFAAGKKLAQSLMQEWKAQ
ncbi:MAG: 2-acyl-glycerophospho-ethanolamine acyltransferase [Gammaproteobacteria bacterium]|jgi:acyl-[acyl-carrier-protein]-phospholipid O-acyltransferase/long-chain-fatty-acid--[acyl-carrier-protein] ligase|nr:2-acyl-glycerophospho-ethanolamine acyltransferase [Gammaproteobacteria bacterium]